MNRIGSDGTKDLRMKNVELMTDSVYYQYMKPDKLIIIITLSVVTACRFSDPIPFKDGDFKMYNGEAHVIRRGPTEDGGVQILLKKELNDSLVTSGFWRAYYANNELAFHHEMHNGKLTGSSWLYPKDGQVAYLWYAVDEVEDYRVIYDKDGHITEEYGDLSPSAFKETSGNSFSLKVTAVEPPHLVLLGVDYQIDDQDYTPLTKRDAFYNTDISFGDSATHIIAIRARYNSDTASFEKIIRTTLQPEW